MHIQAILWHDLEVMKAQIKRLTKLRSWGRRANGDKCLFIGMEGSFRGCDTAKGWVLEGIKGHLISRAFLLLASHPPAVCSLLARGTPCRIGLLFIMPFILTKVILIYVYSYVRMFLFVDPHILFTTIGSTTTTHLIFSAEPLLAMVHTCQDRGPIRS
jgi:hypothetical protein